MKTDFVITSEQVRAARALIRWEQRDLADSSKVSLPSIKRLETTPGPLSAQPRTVDAIRAALEAAGVEFTNGDRPGVRMVRSYKLKDAGKDAFLLDPLAKWVGFGAVDAGRAITVRVEDIALQRLGPSIGGGANQMSALGTYRSKIFKIAAEKYELGLIESGDTISVTDADVARQLG